MATAKKTAAAKKTASTTSRTSGSGVLSEEEKAAARETAQERRRQAKRSGASGAAADLQDCLDKIAALPDEERTMVTRVHELIVAAGPDLAPKTWYGMPAYAKDGQVIAFVQPASKFKARYTTLGFNDGAQLDAGSMWPTAYALTKLTKAGEAEITTLITKAVG